jgi:preprotein translocase subunit SecA
LREYQREAYEMFADLMERIKEEALTYLFHVRIQKEEDLQEAAPQRQEMHLSYGGEEPRKKEPVRREGKKIGRNAPCPCGSGKKYKKCCGAA